MKKVVLATIALVLALEILIIIPLLYFTDPGNQIVRVFNPPTPTPTPTPTFVLTAEEAPPAIKSKAFYLIDADTGNVLANSNSDQPLAIASTSKIMTALLAIEKGDLEKTVLISEKAVNETLLEESSNAGLIAGDRIKLHDLLFALMLPSGNDAAIAIAEEVGGSIDGFVKLMNERAKELGMKNTTFHNPNGLTYSDEEEVVEGEEVVEESKKYNISTAADMALLARTAMQNIVFEQVVRVQKYVLPATDDHSSYEWNSTNNLLASYPGATGIKTGFTEEAGYCLVFAADNGKHNLIGVILYDTDNDGEQRFEDARLLLEWGFSQPLRPPVIQPEQQEGEEELEAA